MGRSQREKGKRGEREIATLFRAAMPGCDIKRGWQTRDGADAPDVDVPGYWIEVKRQKQANVRAALAQAIEGSTGKGRVPMAVIHDDRKEPFAVLMLDDLLDIIREHYAAVRR